MRERFLSLLPPSALTATLRRKLANRSVFLPGPGDVKVAGAEGEVVVVVHDPKLPGNLISSSEVFYEVLPGAILPILAWVDVKLTGPRRKRGKRTFRRLYGFLPLHFEPIGLALRAGKIGITDGRGIAVLHLGGDPEADLYLRRLSAAILLILQVEEENLPVLHAKALSELKRAFPKAPWIEEHIRRVDRFIERSEEEQVEAIAEALDRFADSLEGSGGDGHAGLDYVM